MEGMVRVSMAGLRQWISSTKNPPFGGLRQGAPTAISRSRSHQPCGGYEGDSIPYKRLRNFLVECKPAAKQYDNSAYQDWGRDG